MPARLFAAPLGAISGEIGVAEAILDASSRATAPIPPRIPAASSFSPPKPRPAQHKSASGPTPLMPSCRQAITLRLPLRA